jgi:hypothetical protein
MFTDKFEDIVTSVDASFGCSYVSNVDSLFRLLLGTMSHKDYVWRLSR